MEDFRERKQREFDKLINQDALGSYWDSVKTHQVSVGEMIKRSVSPAKQRQNVLPYNEAREYVLQIITDLFPPVDNKRTRFITSEQNRTMLTNLTKYFINDPDSILDINKGIILFGGVGTGKTSMFRIFRCLVEALDVLPGYDKKYQIYKTSDIVMDVRERANEGIMRKYFYNNICFDDLGREATDSKVYGNSVSVMGEIIFNRYDLFQTNGQLTFATTNLSESEILEKYGDRIHSRMMEMFNWVKMDGQDYRKQ